MVTCKYCLNKVEVRKLCEECKPLNAARQTQAEAIAALEQYIREYDLTNA